MARVEIPRGDGYKPTSQPQRIQKQMQFTECLLQISSEAFNFLRPTRLQMLFLMSEK